MALPSARPRLAIIGGGGAMGRFFARLLCGSVQELYLFDFFDTASPPFILSKVLDDLRTAGAASNLHGVAYGLSHATESQGWLATPAQDSPRPGRAILCLAPETPSPMDQAENRSARSDDSLTRLAETFATKNPDGCTVFAVLPSDADALLPRADITLLAIGTEGKSLYDQAIHFYSPWIRPGSLVVDLGSTQTKPLETLCEVLDRQVGILGAHPLFGPTVSDLTGLIVAVVDAPDGRQDSAWRQWFLDRLAHFRLIVTPASARQHDEAMSYVQALTHFTLLSFAYTFVRLDQDPADLLPFRTPVFEPLLYLAARVAYLARSSPDTYRAIQTQTARPDVRAVFLDTARQLLSAIELAQSRSTNARLAGAAPDPLATLFDRFGSPWSPDRLDRRERQRREHFLEMGARLVDGLNQLRQEIVASAGQVRAIEERRVGQPPRIAIGLVDLDLLDPGKQDVASRIRLRPINLLLGSVQGGEGSDEDPGHDQMIPLARARVLNDAELFDWLLEQGELVVRRTCDLRVPEWFDREILLRLLKTVPRDDELPRSRVWDVLMTPLDPRPDDTEGLKPARIALAIVLHPSELVSMRRDARRTVARELDDVLRDLDQKLDTIHRQVETAHDPATRERAQHEKKILKRQRKMLVDQRTTAVDREVRRLTRARVQAIYQETVSWLTRHGCLPLR